MAEDEFFEDFTILVPKPKVFRIGTSLKYVDVNISVFPAGATLRMMNLKNDGNMEVTVEQLVDVVVEACNNPEITRDFLMNEVGFAQMNAFVSSVINYGRLQTAQFKEKMMAKDPNFGKADGAKKTGGKGGKNSR